MKRLLLIPLLIAATSLTACYETDPEVVAVPVAVPANPPPAEPIVVPVPTPVPVPGPAGEKGEKGDKGETGDTVVPVPIVIDEKDDQTVDEGDR